jgi:AAA domain
MTWDYQTTLAEEFSRFDTDIARVDQSMEEEAQFAEDLMADLDSGLPLIESSDDLVAEDLPLPTEIIKGFLHQGLKGVLGSSSKARKTWILLNLGLSVSEGVEFWGKETVAGKVLYINFEIPRSFMRSRVATLRKCMGLSSSPNFHIWNLRGKAAPLWKLLDDFIRRVKREQFSLVIIDPIYKSLGDREENAAEDVAQVCNEMERIAVETGAAVVYAAHFSKGNQAGKEAIDRISGSGVWARDADSLMIMTKHQEDDCYTIDTILRNLPEQSPFVVRWQYPVMTIEQELDPENLKKIGGRPKNHSEDEVWALLSEQHTTTEWEALAKTELGVSRTRFFAIKKTLQDQGRVLLSKINNKWVQVLPKVPS